MKIGWITDPQCFESGRKFSITHFLESKPEDVNLVNIDLAQPEECDAYIVHSAVSPRNLPTFPKTLKVGLAKPKPVIMYAHNEEIWSFGASSVIYQSPLQGHQHKFGKKFILPPPITLKDFKYDGEIDRTKQIWVGGFDPSEGLDISVRQIETERVTTEFYGWNIPSTSSSNFAKFIGHINHLDMPRLYASSKKLVYHTRSKHPFNRAIAEAILAGCEIEYSGRIGIASFDEPAEKIAESCLESAEKFWGLIGDLTS